MFPPLVSHSVRTPGLRAQQLAEQSQLTCDQVRYVMTRSRYSQLTKNMPLCHTVRSHPDFMVIEDRSLGAFLDRLAPSMFVFGPEEAAQMWVPELHKHVVVTDILSPSTLGHALAQNKALLDRTDRFLINAATNIAQFSDVMEGRSNIVLNPFCPIAPPQNNTVPRDSILFTSSSPTEGPNVAFLTAIAKLFDQRRDMNFVFLSPHKPHDAPESGILSRLIRAPNLRCYASLSYPAYCALLQRSAAVLHWADPAQNTGVTLAPRLLHAVANGASIFGNADTGLDGFWPNYPGETSATVPSATQLESFADKALAQGFSPAVQAAQHWNTAVVTDTGIFAGLS